MTYITKKLIYLLLITSFIFAGMVRPMQAQGPTNFSNCRLGVGGAFSPNVGGYNIAQLNMGLYLDWTTHDDPASDIGLPTDVEYLQMVRLHQDKIGGWNSAYVVPYSYTVSPNLATIASNAASQPGSVWLIGNEIERRDWNGGSQDEIVPELYAQAFHEIRDVILAADPTARIGIGGVIQATPLRLKYLDKVWDSYFTKYGYSMGTDIDVWNVHGFILREVWNDWGADIPAGFNNTDGDPTNNYDPANAFLNPSDYWTALAAHHNMDYYRQFIEDFRTWMAAHGEQNKPLLNTEYGILMDLNDPEVIAFLENSFDYMLTKTDPNIGYPADENRLVQGWIWYSLNDNVSPFVFGTLFNPNKTLTAIGNAWKNYVTNPTHPLASQPQRNILATNLRTEPEYYTETGGSPVDFTLKVDVANSGNISVTNPITVTFWDDDPNAGGPPIGSTQTLNSLSGCGRFTTFEVTWPNRQAYQNTWYVQVETDATETKTSDNIANHTAYIFDGKPEAELQVTKLVDNPAPTEGLGTVKYTIVMTNTGPNQALNVVVEDVLPNGLTFVTYESTQGNYFSAGPWQVGNVITNGGAVLTITAKVDDGMAGLLITNTARISSTASLNTPANDSASVTIEPIEGFQVFVPIILKE